MLTQQLSNIETLYLSPRIVLLDILIPWLVYHATEQAAYPRIFGHHELNSMLFEKGKCEVG